MIRPSSLHLAEHCALSPVLSARFPESNANIQRGIEVEQQVYRALLADEPAADPDAADCVRWLRAHIVVREMQQECALYDGDTFVTKGTPDVVGIDTWENDTLVIVDLKKREQVTWGKIPAVDDNLQLHAYALAHAASGQFRRYRCCLLTFGEGRAEALWSRAYTVVEWRPILDRIRKICLAPTGQTDKDPPGKAGPHCTDCYPRLHCPQWALPAHQGPSALEPFTRAGGLSADNVERAYLAAKAVKEVGERALEQIKAFRRIHGPGSVVVGGKSWEPVTMSGRKTADVGALERDGLAQYIRQGEQFEQWRLVKTKQG